MWGGLGSHCRCFHSALPFSVGGSLHFPKCQSASHSGLLGLFLRWIFQCVIAEHQWWVCEAYKTLDSLTHILVVIYGIKLVIFHILLLSINPIKKTKADNELIPLTSMFCMAKSSTIYISLKKKKASMSHTVSLGHMFLDYCSLFRLSPKFTPSRCCKYLLKQQIWITAENSPQQMNYLLLFVIYLHKTTVSSWLRKLLNLVCFFVTNETTYLWDPLNIYVFSRNKWAWRW